MAIIFTYGFSEAPNLIGQKIGSIGESRTLATRPTARPAC